MSSSKFYVQYEWETIPEAVSNHFEPYPTVDAAIAEAKRGGEDGRRFFVLNHAMQVIHEGTT